MTEALQRILLVEDDADIRLMVRLSLEMGGFELEVCASGREALAAAPRFEPQLLLLDIMLPDMDGVATLEALRRLPGLAEVPVIFLTARAETRDLEEYRARGPLGIILKPFDPMTLADQVCQMWAGDQPG